jgi:acetate kinase
MDAILVVNAGSSSVKFQIFEQQAPGDPQRLIKGQFDGIGTRPRLRAEIRDGKRLIDKTYAPQEVADVAAAIAAAG